MKIVNVIFTSQNGGAEQAFIDYSAVLKNLGHDVLAIVKIDAPYADQLEKLGVKVEKIKNKFGYHDVFAVKKIKKILEEFDADVVLAHIGRAMILTRKAIKKIKTKKILQVCVNHSMSVKRSIGADLVFSVNRKAFYRTIDLGQKEDHSFVIPNAIDVSDAILQVPKINLQKQDIITIGAMARIDDKKGFDHLVSAISKLEKLNPQKKFLLKIAGTGPFEGFLRDLVKKLNIEKKIEFCGWVKNKKEFFQSIDIFCSASDNETFGLVLLEAMKFRKPIIATNTIGSQEVLRDKIDGLIVEIKPAQSLDERIVSAVNALCETPELAQEMIENSFTRVQEKFSYAALEMRLKEFFGRTGL
jgi:glycosyltransferase involved in cell wall biosynthesis